MRFDSVLQRFPAPIVHNKRLAEILFALMSQHIERKPKFGKPGSLDIITCHDYPGKSLFERSLDLLRITGAIVLKESFSGPWRNTFKLQWVLNHLERTPNGAEWVLFCDADDTLIKDDPHKVLEIFHSKNCQLLFMSSNFEGGYACMLEKKQWSDSLRPGRYLNSGVYIGRRNFILTVLREACTYVTEDAITAEESRRLGHGVIDNRLRRRLPDYPRGSQDQDILRYIHPDFYPDMQIDYDNELAFRNL